MEKRNVPIKNYIILALLIITTVFITFHLANKYKVENNYYKNSSPLYGVLFEIKVEELDNYLLDNPNTAIYVVNGDDNDISEMDVVIKEIILENDLNNDVIVIDTTTNINSVTSELNKLLHDDLRKYKNDLLSKTNLLIIKDRVIDDILVPKTKNKEEIISFFRKNGVM